MRVLVKGGKVVFRATREQLLFTQRVPACRQQITNQRAYVQTASSCLSATRIPVPGPGVLQATVLSAMGGKPTGYALPYASSTPASKEREERTCRHVKEWVAVPIGKYGRYVLATVMYDIGDGR